MSVDERKLTTQNELTDFLLYTAPDRQVKVKYILHDETICLTQNRITELFGVQCPSITKHLKNIFESGELEEEHITKSFVMDDERLKNGQFFGKDYFRELLERVRSIRASGHKFYQKITDIYATSIDYDVTARATKRFFATVQNKLLSL